MKYYSADAQKMSKFIAMLGFVHERARRVFPKMRAGFCFALYGLPSCHLAVKGMVGKVRHFKTDMYFRLVEEKAGRVFIRNEASSYESRNPDDGRYGGAIRGKTMILAISGLKKEHQDEAIAMATLVLLSEMELAFANDIAERTGNKYFEEILTECGLGGRAVGGRTGGER